MYLFVASFFIWMNERKDIMQCMHSLTCPLKLSFSGPLTLFAPFNIGWVNSLVNVTRLLQPAWNAHLTDLLLHQTADQEYFAGDLALGQQVIMLSGETIHVTQAYPNALILNYNATVTEPDKDASNGVVQAMNGVLLPVSASECIYEYAVNNPDTFSVLADLIVRADLIGVLCGPGPSTFFAPDNAAFEELKKNNWDDFVNDPQKVRNLLLYHLVEGNVFASDLKNVNAVQSVQGSEIQVSSNAFETSPPTEEVYYEERKKREYIETKQESSYSIFLNQDSEVIYPDVLVENGVWHTIAKVLLPPTVEDPTIAELLEQEGLTVFVSAARRTGLYDTLNNPSEVLTVFATDNTGFYPDFSLYLNNYDYSLHLKAAMEYQVVSGKALWTAEMPTGLEMPTLLQNETLIVTQGTPNPIIVNMGPTVLNGDFLGSNGAMHIIDKVLPPPFSTTNIIDVIARQPTTFSTLVYLMVLTGLIPELSGRYHVMLS
jgi:transforming growth factor-beta-induced protein